MSRSFVLTPVTVSGFDHDRWMLEFIMLIGGIEQGGSGIAISPSGKPHPVDPHGWRTLSPAQRDIVIGRALNRLAAMISNPGARRDLQRLGRDLATLASNEIIGGR